MILFLVALSTVPLLYPEVLPLADLPGHMGRYYAGQLVDSDPFLRRFYTYQWKPIGNLGVDVPVFLLGKFMGVEAATKLIVGAIPPLMTAGFLLTYRKLWGALSPFAVLATVLTYTTAMHWGFVNFWLGVALGWWAALIDLRGYRGRRTEALTLLLMGGVLWFVHAFAFALFAIILAALRVGRCHDWRAVRNEAIRFIPFGILPVLLQGYWMLATATNNSTSGFLLYREKLSAVLRVFLYDDYRVAALMIGAFVLTVVALALRCGVRVNRAGAASFGAIALTFVLLPETMMQSWGADMRTVPILMMCALLMLAPRHPSVVATGLAPALACLFTVYWAVSYARQSERIDAVLAVADPITEHSRVAQLIVGECDVEGWPPLQVTYAAKGLLIGRKRSFVPVWNVEGQNVLEARYDGHGLEASTGEGTLPESCARPGVPALKTKLATFPPHAFDYVLVIGRIPDQTPAPSQFELVRRNGEATLFRISSARLREV